MERFLIFFTCFSFLASGVSICELCSALCRCDGLHGVGIMVTVLLRWPVRYCAFIDPGQVKKTRNTKVGAMDIEEAPDQPSRRIGSQKSHQIVAYCHILSLLVRGCHGAHISIALSREWKERSSGFSVAMHLELVGSVRSWQYPRPIRRYDHYCALGCNRCLMARDWWFLPCSFVNLILLILMDIYGHHINCQIIINYLISNIQWYDIQCLMSKIQYI